MVGAPGTTGALGRVRAALLLLGQPFASSPVTGILDISLEPVLWIGCPIGRPGSAELPLPVGSSGGWGVFQQLCIPGGLAQGNCDHRREMSP